MELFYFDEPDSENQDRVIKHLLHTDSDLSSQIWGQWRLHLNDIMPEELDNLCEDFNVFQGYITVDSSGIAWDRDSGFKSNMLDNIIIDLDNIFTVNYPTSSHGNRYEIIFDGNSLPGNKIDAIMDYVSYAFIIVYDSEDTVVGTYDMYYTDGWAEAGLSNNEIYHIHLVFDAVMTFLRHLRILLNEYSSPYNDDDWILMELQTGPYQFYLDDNGEVHFS